MTDRTTLISYKTRSHIMRWTLVYFFGLDIVGAIVIIFLIPEPIACRLNSYEWFIALWPTNFINLAILRNHPGNLDPCRAIPVTAWSAVVGIIMLVSYVIVELLYNARTIKLELRSFFFLFIMAIIDFLPIQHLNPTIIEYRRFEVYSINIRFPSIISEIELIVISFIAFFMFSLCFSILIIWARSKIDHHKSKKNPI